jgi:hypothetical protein
MKEKLEGFLDQEKQDNNPNLELNRDEVTMVLKFIKKAEKWDRLDLSISRFYDDEEAEGYLGDIGEICALQLGYI